jgi:hypothetical protein
MILRKGDKVRLLEIAAHRLKPISSISCSNYLDAGARHANCDSMMRGTRSALHRWSTSVSTEGQ